MHPEDTDSKYHRFAIKPAEFGKFAEVGRTLQEAGVSGIDDLTEASHALLKVRELETIRSTILKDMSSLPIDIQNDPAIGNLIDKLNLTTDINVARSIATQIPILVQQATSRIALSNTITDTQTREQAFLAHLDHYREDTLALRKEWGKLGFHDSPENKKKLHALWQRLDLLQPFSPEWHNTINEIQAMDEKYFARMEDEFAQKGKNILKQKARDMKEAIQSSQKHHKELDQPLYNDYQKIIEEKALTKKQTHFVEDDTDPTFSTSCIGNLTPTSFGSKQSGNKIRE